MKKDSAKNRNASTKQTEFLSVAPEHFDRIEHYGNRSTIWIKIYLDYLNNFLFCLLPDETKFHFIGLLLLSVQMFNKLPNNAAFLQQKLSATSEIDIDLLIENGFLIAFKSLKRKKKSASTNNAITEQQNKEQEADLREQRNNNSASAETVAVSLLSSRFSLKEINEYYEHCLSTNTITNPIGFLKHLESGKGDNEINSFYQSKNRIEKSDIPKQKVFVCSKCGSDEIGVETSAGAYCKHCPMIFSKFRFTEISEISD